MESGRIKNKYLLIFLSILKISATTFGGGFVIIPLLKRQFVDEYKLINEEEILDLTAIAQACPGPIAVNASILVGYKIAGVMGGLVALLGSVIPPLVIISIISLFYAKFRDNIIIRLLMAGMLCGVAAVIINVVIDMTLKLKKLLPYIILVGAFIMKFVFNINILIILAVAAIIGLISVLARKGDKK